jgi:hypothetical protein
MKISELLNESQPPKIPQKPRQGPLRTQTGGGAHKDKTKTIPRKEKHKTKDFAESAELPICEYCGNRHEQELDERGRASRTLCLSSKPDSELGASNLSSCKSQGLRARTGNKSHKLGKSPKSRVKMDGHRIKGKKYGGPLPDWS